jgi:hypothetical protein
MKNIKGLNKNIEVTLDDILRANNLRDINGLLTKSMAKLQIQALIKDDNLSLIVNKVVDVANNKIDQLNKNIEGYSSLLASAILGRIGAVARARESKVYLRLEELLESKPASIEDLEDGDEKYYAALALGYHKAPWLLSYCLEQATLIDTSENARRTLLSNSLNETGNLTSFWLLGSEYFTKLKSIEAHDKRYKKIRRITSAWSEAVKDWNGDVGENPGAALATWIETLVITKKDNVEITVLIDIFDDFLSMLKRIIELRFSYALLAPTYAVLEKSRSYFGKDIWGLLLKDSIRMKDIRLCLMEAALVLVRQGITDPDLAKMLVISYFSRNDSIKAIKLHFKDADDLDPEKREWWFRGGLESKNKRTVEHKIGNSEDQQIGSLLIEVEASKEVMDKLSRAVVPLLQMSSPPLAESVKKAAAGYVDMARITRQLARMRKITQTDLQGSVMEYNALQHELLGGHKLGIRKIRVVREGIKKEFGGKIKTLVKPWVESVNDEY